MEPGVNVKDVRALEDLATTFQYAGESLSRIAAGVDAYLTGVQGNLGKQLNFLQKQVELAQKNVEHAEKALSACLSSRSSSSDDEDEDEETDCSCEERDVRIAKERLDECQKKLEAGNEICDKCKDEIDNYHYVGGFCDPPGGHVMMEHLTSESTQKAVDSLHQCMEALQEIQGVDMGNDEAPEGISNPYRQDEEPPLTDEERAQRLQGFLEEKKAMQAEKANYQGANRAMKCPDCGRPLALCICKVK